MAEQLSGEVVPVKSSKASDHGVENPLPAKVVSRYESLDSVDRANDGRNILKPESRICEEGVEDLKSIAADSAQTRIIHRCEKLGTRERGLV